LLVAESLDVEAVAEGEGSGETLGRSCLAGGGGDDDAEVVD